MTVFKVNPDASNPLYEDSVRLHDITPGVRYIAFSAEYGIVSVVNITSDWWVEDDAIGLLAFAPFLFAEDSDGRVVNLCDEGIHPYFDGTWSNNRFAIVATDENLKNFHSWLETQGHSRAAAWLKELFPDLMVGLDESFWKRLTDHLNC